MSSPVQLSDLPAAASPLSPSGLMLYRSGLTDYQATLSQVQAILINALNPLGYNPQPTDLMMVQPSSGAATSQVYFGQVGFTAGTVSWFYQATAPMFWSSIGTGDTILAVAGGSQAYNVTAGNVSGTWQQGDVGGVPGTGLTVAQMPAHGHSIRVRDDSGFNSNDNVRSANASSANSKTITAPIGSSGSSSGTGGTSQAHNHGNVWRPMASVGIICQKTS